MATRVFGSGAEATAKHLAIPLLLALLLASACSSSAPPSDPAGQATTRQSAQHRGPEGRKDDIGADPDRHNDATRSLARLRATLPGRLVGDRTNARYTDEAPARIAPAPVQIPVPVRVIGRPKTARLGRSPAVISTAAPLKSETLAAPRAGLSERPAVVIQLAAHRSDARARANWRRLRAAFPDLLGDLAPVIQRADLGARGVFYRVRTGPFKIRAEAQGLCRQLRARGQDCLVVAAP